MKILVLYRSKSGFTRKYADMLSQELKSDILDIRKSSRVIPEAYDTIIFGGSLHAVGINGLELFKKKLVSAEKKKIIIFAVGASPYSQKVFEEVKTRNMQEDKLKGASFFYLRGGFDFSKLPWQDKFLMLLMKASILVKKKRTSDEEGMLAAYSHPVDFTDKKHIIPIVEEALKAKN